MLWVNWQNKTLMQGPPSNKSIKLLKADLEGTIFACHYHARLAYTMTFNLPHNFHLRTSTICHTNVLGLIKLILHSTVCHEFMMYASRAR